MSTQTLGKYIRELREEKDLSLREFAGKLDKSAPFISDIELGRRYPSDEALGDIARVLGVSKSKLEKYDFREPLKEIRARAESNPKFMYALRNIASEYSADEIYKLAGRKKKRR